VCVCVCGPDDPSGPSGAKEAHPVSTVEGAPSLKMRCVEKDLGKRKKAVRERLPDEVGDRLGELLAADALEEALEGLSPEQITGRAGCLPSSRAG